MGSPPPTLPMSSLPLVPAMTSFVLAMAAGNLAAGHVADDVAWEFVGDTEMVEDVAAFEP